MENNTGCSGLLFLFLIIAITVSMTNIVHYVKPKALDVYQGKITLEYKIVDGVVIDSCVVWKSK